jgi:hypothetical protein
MDELSMSMFASSADFYAAIRADALEEAAKQCDTLAEMMELGAGELEPGGRLRQAAHMIRALTVTL